MLWHRQSNCQSPEQELVRGGSLPGMAWLLWASIGPKAAYGQSWLVSLSRGQVKQIIALIQKASSDSRNQKWQSMETAKHILLYWVVRNSRARRRPLFGCRFTNDNVCSWSNHSWVKICIVKIKQNGKLGRKQRVSWHISSHSDVLNIILEYCRMIIKLLVLYFTYAR